MTWVQEAPGSVPTLQRDKLSPTEGCHLPGPHRHLMDMRTLGNCTIPFPTLPHSIPACEVRPLAPRGMYRD